MPITRRGLILSSACAPLIGYGAAAQGGPEAIQTVNVITFPGTYNLLLWAAEAKGWSAEEGLGFAIDFTPTSMHLIEQLLAQNYGIASSSIDNVIAYTNGQGQFEPEGEVDLIAVCGLAPNQVLPLYVQPDIETFEQLKGRTLAVDALSTGFSFALRAIVEHHGLEAADYELASVGSARDRLAALVEGSHAGAVLTPPFDGMAEANGLRRLGDTVGIVDPYQAGTLVTTRRWAEANPDALVGLLRVVIRADAWLKNPDNHAEAAEILQANMTQLSSEAAAGAVAGLAGSLSLDINEPGLENVLALRRRYGVQDATLLENAAYVDLTYLAAARRSL